MAYDFRLFPLCFMLFVLLVNNNNVICQEEGAARSAMVPAMFIFGDSLIDNGNNNNLASLAKANYFPYGIDFNGGPTGRFSNGLTMVDVIGMYISTFFFNFFFLSTLYFIFQMHAIYMSTLC